MRATEKTCAKTFVHLKPVLMHLPGSRVCVSGFLPLGTPDGTVCLPIFVLHRVVIISHDTTRHVRVGVESACLSCETIAVEARRQPSDRGTWC